MITPIAPSAPELLDLVLAIPDDVYAPDFSDQPDDYSWRDSDATPAGNLHVMPAPAKTSLRALVDGVEAIADTIEGLDDDTLTEDAKRELTALLIAAIAGTKKKVDACSATLALFESLEAAAKVECTRLEKRSAYYRRQRDSLERYVLATMEASNLERMDGDTSSLQARRNPPAVVIDDLAAVPREYIRVPPPPAPAPDKTMIKRAILAGGKIAGCRLDSGTRLVRS
jgi:hypothetical protein